MSGPSGPSSRWWKYACRPSLKSEKPVPAPTSEPSATRTPCSSVPQQREQPAAERRVAGRAVRDRGAARAQHPQLVVGGMDVVGQHRAGPHEAVPVVGVDVVTAVGEEPGHRAHLRDALVDVRGEPRPAHLGVHRPARRQHLVAGGVGEPRGDGVAQPTPAVPSGRQRHGLVVRTLRRRQQRLGQVAVADHQPAGDPQADLLGLSEERVDGGGEVRAEDQRRGRPRRHQAGDELLGDRRGVRRLREPSLLGSATGRATPAAASRARRSPAPAGSARGCPPGRAAARRRAGRARPRRGGRPAARPGHRAPRSRRRRPGTRRPRRCAAPRRLAGRRECRGPGPGRSSSTAQDGGVVERVQQLSVATPRAMVAGSLPAGPAPIGQRIRAIASSA